MGTRVAKGMGLKVLLAGCGLALLGTLAGCASTAELIGRQEDQLAAAGFEQRPANTPDREAMLKRLPPNQFVRRVNGDEVTYVYGDPVVCNCLYVGTQQAYGQYVRFVQARRLVEEQRTTAMMYSDPAWNWGAWGPWGPRFGFHRGFGW